MTLRSVAKSVAVFEDEMRGQPLGDFAVARSLSRTAAEQERVE